MRIEAEPCEWPLVIFPNTYFPPDPYEYKSLLPKRDEIMFRSINYPALSINVIQHFNFVINESNFFKGYSFLLF